MIVACGTSYHAGLAGRYAIEEWARVPVEVEIASEYRYRNPVVGPRDLVIGVSQSGETADTLAAMRTARAGGATVLALCNVMGSQMTREADGVLYTRAGIEIGVAATKTFVTQVVALYLLALRLAELRGALGRDGADRADPRGQAPAAPDHRDARAPVPSGRSQRIAADAAAARLLHVPRAATPGCRSRSRARSSSRRSPTSRPTPTLPAR